MFFRKQGLKGVILLRVWCNFVVMEDISKN